VITFVNDSNVRQSLVGLHYGTIVISVKQSPEDAIIGHRGL